MNDVTPELRFSHLALAQRRPRTERLQRGLLQTLLVVVLILLPQSVFSQPDCQVSGDIPFSLTKPGEDILLSVGGPWFRDSGCLVFPQELVACTSFYAANTTPTSPFGLWLVSVDRPVAPCPRNGSAFKKFCLGKEGFAIGSSVNITIRGAPGTFDIEISGKTVTIPPDQNNPNCGWGVLSYLGDHQRQGGRDRDTDDFLFNGVVGEEITIKLEADQQSGNTGGRASLSVRGGSLHRFVEGELPLQIIARLPSSGKYSVEVAQPRIPRGERYEGKYFLSVESPTSNVGPLELGENVER